MSILLALGIFGQSVFRGKEKVDDLFIKQSSSWKLQIRTLMEKEIEPLIMEKQEFEEETCQNLIFFRIFRSKIFRSKEQNL